MNKYFSPKLLSELIFKNKKVRIGTQEKLTKLVIPKEKAYIKLPEKVKPMLVNIAANSFIKKYFFASQYIPKIEIKVWVKNIILYPMGSPNININIKNGDKYLLWGLAISDMPPQW